jgi:hypothetical protein
MCTYIYIHTYIVCMCVYICDLKQNRNLLASFIKDSKYEISRKSFGWETCCVMRTDSWLDKTDRWLDTTDSWLDKTDSWLDKTTLVISSHSCFAKSPNVYLIFISLCLYEYYFRNSSRSSFSKCNVMETWPVSFSNYNAPNRVCSCKVIFQNTDKMRGFQIVTVILTDSHCKSLEIALYYMLIILQRASVLYY